MEVAGQKITTYGIALLGIVLIGAFLRVYHLGTQSIWFDEAYSVGLSSLSVPQIVQAAAADVQPPLYYLLLHYWMMAFGTSESAVRLLSVLFGVLAIPMIYVVGRQLFNKEVGLVAALILALSSFNIYYSQETWMYSFPIRRHRKKYRDVKYKKSLNRNDRRSGLITDGALLEAVRIYLHK